jgi:hypothetical protein
MKIKPYFLVFAMSVAATSPVIGAVKKPVKTQESKVSADAIAVSKAKDAVLYVLKDPQSAMFRNVHVGTEDFKPVRGEVNSKNSYGGYTGFDRFYFDGRDGKVFFKATEVEKWEDWLRAVRSADELLRRSGRYNGSDVEIKQKAEHDAEMKRLFEDGW